MTAAIAHRGPDGDGVFVEAGVGLGHRRLSIIDLTNAGSQPMATADDRFVITYNGELYNFQELRRELEERGHSFRSRSDTEVLLVAWAEWGPAVLSRFNGMFAFAVWDNKERTLTLVRDHVGIKPLYYTLIPAGNDAPTTFLFGSEIKAILASGLIKPKLNRHALHQFLTFLWSPDPNTLFADIKTVPPGHLLQFHNDEVKLTQWWDVSFDAIEEGKNEAWWRERVLDTLDRVVKMEMVADVPLGSFLSGGIDSSGIVAMMERHSNGRRISTYTVGIESEDLRYDIIPDDVRWARRVNEQLQTDYHEIM